MGKRVLITGGAGFIGSHLADELLRAGYAVRALDNLSPQVHGQTGQRPAYLHRDVELLIGDVRDSAAVERSLRNVDAVFHFAALVGVGQSMYEIARYTDVNNRGTAVLLEALIKTGASRLIVASSMSVYGEGLYRAADGRAVPGVARTQEQLRQHRWEVQDADGRELRPAPTPETKPPTLSSIYALSKYDQERLCLLTGDAYGVPTTALRFFNVYGTRQALSNPYTGVLAIFAARLLNRKRPLLYEDGCQQRDFVSVQDVARACRLALESPNAGGVYNVGSGCAYTVAHIAERMAAALDCQHLAPEITGQYRVGDIRHCYADITQAAQMLGYAPCVALEEGIMELADWLAREAREMPHDRVAAARAELETRGLTR